MSDRRRWGLCLLLGLLMIAFFTLLNGCSGDERVVMVAPQGDVQATCEGCHTSQEMLVATALPDPPPPAESGEG